MSKRYHKIMAKLFLKGARKVQARWGKNKLYRNFKSEWYRHSVLSGREFGMEGALDLTGTNLTYAEKDLLSEELAIAQGWAGKPISKHNDTGWEPRPTLVTFEQDEDGLIYTFRNGVREETYGLTPELADQALGENGWVKYNG